METNLSKWGGSYLYFDRGRLQCSQGQSLFSLWVCWFACLQNTCAQRFMLHLLITDCLRTNWNVLGTFWVPGRLAIHLFNGKLFRWSQFVKNRTEKWFHLLGNTLCSFSQKVHNGVENEVILIVGPYIKNEQCVDFILTAPDHRSLVFPSTSFMDQESTRLSKHFVGLLWGNGIPRFKVLLSAQNWTC